MKTRDFAETNGVEDLSALGVGITYSPAIEPLLLQEPGLFDVLEIEPQTVWTETLDLPPSHRVSDALLEHLEGLPGRKLVHSIGAPVGGTAQPDPLQLALLRQNVARLGSPWVSEHLSFNSTRDFSTGFFLPPCPTPEGVDTAVRNIQALQTALSVPLAIETGVNYMRPRPGEMTDGEFVAAVAMKANCGILLDLHNIYANELNGRQSVADFLAELPLDRVWEVHLAGGFEMDGFWLDAHSGGIPDSLFDRSKEIVATLTNLKAIIFEIFPSFVAVAGPKIILEQIERLHLLWQLRGKLSHEKSSIKALETISVGKPISQEEWERVLGALVIGRQPPGAFANEVAADPGVSLVHRLIGEFRASMIVSVLRLTSRLLMLNLGHDTFRMILEDFWSKNPPHQYASSEAESFAQYLADQNLALPQLNNILAFDRAVLATLLDGKNRVISFKNDPLPLLRALTEGHLTDFPSKAGVFEIEITAGDASAMEVDIFSQGFHYH